MSIETGTETERQLVLLFLPQAEHMSFTPQSHNLTPTHQGAPSHPRTYTFSRCSPCTHAKYTTPTRFYTPTPYHLTTPYADKSLTLHTRRVHFTPAPPRPHTYPLTCPSTFLHLRSASLWRAPQLFAASSSLAPFFFRFRESK